MAFMPLVNNIALLLVLAVPYRYIVRRWAPGSVRAQILTGVLFSAIAVIGMSVPMHFAPGIIFDARSVFASVGGSFGGPVAAAMIAFTVSGYRLWLGGAGTLTGVGVTVTSAAIGVAFHTLRRRRPGITSALSLLGLGLLVHVTMLLWMLTLPSEYSTAALARLSVPLLLVFPLGTLILGRMLADDEAYVQAEKALRESEEKYRTLMEGSLQGIAVLQKFRIVFANPRFAEIYGYSVEELLSLPPEKLQAMVHPEERALVWGRFRDRLAGKAAISQYKYRGIRKDGTVRWLEISASRIEYGGKPAILGTVIDITERRHAEDELRRSREQLRELALYLQSIREEERTRIAREVHDELGQALTALKMDVSWLQRRMPGNLEPLVEKTASMSALIDDTVHTVQRIASELRPGLLDDLGLAAAIEWQAGDFQNRTGIRCSVEIVPEEVAADRKIATAIFRIFQETLTNIARHAVASRVDVRLRENAGRLVLTVRDDGVGITEAQIADPRAFGIIGMRERVRALGGEIRIVGVPERGTTVTVDVPLERREGSDDSHPRRG